MPKQSEFPGLKKVTTTRSDGVKVTYFYHRATKARIDHPYGSRPFRDRYRELEAITDLPTRAVPPGSFEAAYLKYLKNDKYTELKVRTAKEYNRYFDQVLSLLGEIPIKDIRRRHIKAVLNELYPDKNPSWNRCLAAIQAVFSCALDLELIEINPALRINKKKEGEPMRLWKKWEIQDFRQHWPLGTRERLAMEVAYGSVQRHTDIRSFTYRTLQQSGLKIRTSKTDETARPTIDGDVQLAVDAWIDTRHRTAMRLNASKRCKHTDIPEYPDLDEPIFMSLNLDKPLGPSGFSHMMTEAIRAADLGEDLCAYALRHTAIVEMLKGGSTLEDIRYITGHKDICTLERYIYHWQGDEGAERAKAARRKIAMSRDTKIQAPT